MSDQLMQMTTQIVANYVSGNKVGSSELTSLIKSVFQTRSTVDAPQTEAPPAVEKPSAGQIRKSIKPDGLVSFEDGKTYKTLKRHLSTFGLTIDSYKAKWGLPRDYPSTAPDYSARRSAMAKANGLGQMRARAAEPAPAKRGRGKAKSKL
jgi:predicted transcriptional regulator